MKKPVEKKKTSQMSVKMGKIFKSILIEDRIFMARVAEEAGMFEDMNEYTNDMLEQKFDDFTVEERNLLSVAFKAQINPDRQSIKLVRDLSEHPKIAKFKENMKTY